MSIGLIAKVFDEADMPLEACWAYEVAIQGNDRCRELFVNLAFVYLSISDLGYAASKRIPDEITGYAGQRSREILHLSRNLYGPGEEDFWLSYFDFVELGSSMPIEAPTHAGDVIFLYYRAASDSSQGIGRARLFSQCENEQTFKARFIRQVLNSHASARSQ